MNKRDRDYWLDDYAPLTEHRFSEWLYLSRPMRIAYRFVQVFAVALAFVTSFLIIFAGWR